MTTTPPARRGELARGLAASLGLLALLVGVPAMLVAIAGWPLPREVPTLLEVQTALTRRHLSDEVLVDVIAVVGWLVWAIVVVGVAAELGAAIRGRLAAPLPAPFNLTQRLAARLVSAALLLGPSSGALARPAAVAATDVPTRAAPVVRSLQATAPDADRDGQHHGVQDQDQESEAVRRARKVYVVRPRTPGREPDTLWGIAERHLPSRAGELPGMRWREIFELNRGRRQPDGRRLTDPDWIFPGWKLVLPDDATGLPERSPTPAPHPPNRTDRPGDSTPEPAPTTATTATPSTTAPSTATTATTPRTSISPAIPTAPPGPSATTPSPSSRPPAAQPTDDDTPAGWALVAGLGGLLAAGIAGLLARRRRRQQRLRQPGRRPRLPTGSAARLEPTVAAAADPDLPRTVDLAARLLAAAVRGADPAPTVQAITLTDTTIDLHVAESGAQVPPPFAATDDPHRWRLERPAVLAELEPAAADLPCPLPTLVTLGASDAGLVLLNLDAAPVTAITGDPTDAQAILNAMAVELATAPDDRVISLLLVGFGAELAELPRVRTVDGLDDTTLNELDRRAAATRQLLDDIGQPSVPAARLAGVLPDSWAPTILLCAPSLPADQHERLTAICDRSAITAVVSAGPADESTADADRGPQRQEGWRLEVRAGWAQLDPVGVGAQPQQLTHQQYTDIAALLETAADTDGVAADSPPYDRHPPVPAAATDVAPADPNPDAGPEPAPEPSGVGVEVLGPIAISGGATPIERGKSVELIVYLSLHPHGSDADRVWEALWPGRPLKRSTLHSTVSGARVGLGIGPDGTSYVADARDGRYRLAGRVRLDWAEFETLAAVGQAGQGPEADAALERALALVRGEPLETNKPRSYDWATVSRMEMATRIAEVAELLARRRLEAGDPAAAAAAARRGLLGAPLDERLFRILMEAADQAGQGPGAVDRILDELVARLEVEDPDEELHPETVALYRRLRRRAHRGGSVAGRTR